MALAQHGAVGQAEALEGARLQGLQDSGEMKGKGQQPGGGLAN